MIAINIFASTNPRFLKRNVCALKEKEFSNETGWLCPLRCSGFLRRHHRDHLDSLSPLTDTEKQQRPCSVFISVFISVLQWLPSPVPAKLSLKKQLAASRRGELVHDKGPEAGSPELRLRWQRFLGASLALREVGKAKFPSPLPIPHFLSRCCRTFGKLPGFPKDSPTTSSHSKLGWQKLGCAETYAINEDVVSKRSLNYVFMWTEKKKTHTRESLTFTNAANGTIFPNVEGLLFLFFRCCFTKIMISRRNFKPNPIHRCLCTSLSQSDQIFF